MFGTRRVSVSPVPRPSRAGSWADRGRPQAGLRHAPCAAALFAFKSRSWGCGGEGTGTVLAGTLCFGVYTSSAPMSQCPALEACSGGNEPSWPGQARGAIPEWKGSSDPARHPPFPGSPLARPARACPLPRSA